MVLPEKLKRVRAERGFTLIEVLVVLAISTLMILLIATIFQIGLRQVSHSSGRIEMVRDARQAIDNVQRYLASVMRPIMVYDADGDELEPTSSIFWPREFHDPVNGQPKPWEQRVQFFTQWDFFDENMDDTERHRSWARTLNENPLNFSYEIVTVPSQGRGQELVVRALNRPEPWSVGNLPLLPDTSVTPRVIGKRLGVADSNVPGGFRDGFLVRRPREGGLLIQVTVSPDLISDEYNRNKVEQRMTPVVITTIYQPPYFNLN